MYKILASDKVAAHKYLRELFWILVLAKPNREVLLVEVLPEMWDRYFHIFVAIDFLKIV